MTQLDIRGSVLGSTSLAYKAPVLCASTANLVLNGAQTVDGVSVGYSGERVLVKNQANLTENGIYIAATSDWTYAQDWDNNNNVSDGTQVLVISGATNAGLVFVQTCTDSPIIIGTSLVTFVTAGQQAAMTPLTLNLRTYGAVGNGVTDDTAAIVAWLTAVQGAASPVVGYAPAGNYIFKSALSIDTAGGKSGVTIYGDGPHQTIFTYAGSSTTIDLFTVGDGIGNVQSYHWFFHGFKIISNTTMSAGTALKLNSLGRCSFRHITIDGQDGTGKFFNGIWFNGVDVTTIDDFEARGSNDGFRVNGIVGGDQSDLYLRSGKISLSNVGLRVGGAFGGLEVDDVDVIANNFNVIIDQSLAASPNLQLFFGKGFACDVCNTGPGFQLLDAGDASQSVLVFTGAWIASSPNVGFYVGTGSVFRVNFTGGTITNCMHEGVFDASGGTVKLSLVGVRIYNNGLVAGSAISSSGPVIMLIQSCTFEGNSFGNIATTVNAVPVGGSTSILNTLFPFGNGIGVYYGSNAPTIAAAKSSLYLRTDGSSATTRLYVNTDGSTGWTNVVTST